MLVVLAAAMALSLKLNAIGPVASTDAAHVYLGARIAEGARPYLDFLSSRPAGHLWVLAQLARLEAFGWEAAQSAALVTFFLSAALVWLAARRFGRVGAAVAPLAMLLSYEALALSSRPAGELFAMPALAAGALLAERGRWVAAGALLALAPACSFSMAVPLVALLAVVLIESRRNAGRLVAGMLGGLVVVGAAVLAGWGTDALVQPVKLAMRLPGPESSWARLSPVVLNTAGWWVLAAFAPLLAMRGQRIEAARWVVPVLVTIAAVAVSRRMDRWDVAAIAPFVALAAGRAAQAAWARYEGWSLSGEAARGGRWAVMCVAVALLAGVSGDRVAWRVDDPTPGGRNSASASRGGEVARRLFWQEQFAFGTRPAWPTRLLWRDSQRSTAAIQIASVVREGAAPREQIFGDSAITPLVALMTGRRVVHDLVDPALAFLDEAEVGAIFERVDRAAPRYVVRAARRGLVGAPPFKRWAREKFQMVGAFQDSPGGYAYLDSRRYQGL